jgi:flagellar M-ring protein FliF
MNALWKSIMEIWRGLSMGQRITLFGTTLLTVAVMAVLVFWTQKPQLSLLYGGLDPQAASKITDELRDQKIPYEISGGGRAIYVPSSMVYDLRMKVAAKGILSAGASGNGVGFELFDKPTFGLSDFLQKANYYRALQGELARTISELQEVESARVLIVVPNDRLFAADKTEAKASVFLQLRNSSLGRQQINAIRFLVANGVEGLKANRVAIVDNSGNLLADPDGENGAGLTTTQLEVKKNLESLYTMKVQTMLDQVLGREQSVVRATIDMSFDNIQQTEERFDPTPVLRSQTLVVEESNTPTVTSGGAASVTSNVSTNDTSQVQSVANSNSKKQNTSSQYEVTKLVQNTLKGTGELKRISVAVFINEQSNKPFSDEDKTKVEKIVKGAIGYTQEGKGKRNDEVAIEKFPFAVVAADLAAKPAVNLPDKWGVWISWGGQIFLVLLALGLVFYFRRLLGDSHGAQLDTEISIEEILKGEETKARGAANAITVQEITKLIKENPGNMAQSLKTWLGP